MKSSLIPLLLFICSALLMPVMNVRGQSEIDYVLEYAETKVASAFKALRVAESNGADIASLVARLNDAILLLDEAKISYLEGGFDDVKRRASESTMISSSVEAEAKSLVEQARQQAEEGFRTLSMYTFLASVLMLLGLFGAWRLFKARYRGRILEAKPEVVASEP